MCLHTQTFTNGRGDPNKDLLLYNHRLETNSHVSSHLRTQTVVTFASRAPRRASELQGQSDHQPTPASEAGSDAAGSSWKRLACGHDEDDAD